MRRSPLDVTERNARFGGGGDQRVLKRVRTNPSSRSRPAWPADRVSLLIWPTWAPLVGCAARWLVAAGGRAHGCGDVHHASVSVGSGVAGGVSERGAGGIPRWFCPGVRAARWHPGPGPPDNLRVSEGGVARAVYIYMGWVYTGEVTKRLIDVDDMALAAARARLGTQTIKDTVNQALRAAADERSEQLDEALSVLADADLEDRAAAWR